MEELARVYARSLFEVAVEQDKLDTVKGQLAQFADALNTNPDLAVFFFSPYFSTQEKQDGLKQAVEGADPALDGFLKLLVENHRMPAVFRIRREFDRLWAEHNELLGVEITSAVELDAETVESIGNKIAERTGKKVELKTTVNDSIIGGVVLRVGNSILDASIKARLDQLRKELAKSG